MAVTIIETIVIATAATVAEPSFRNAVCVVVTVSVVVSVVVVGVVMVDVTVVVVGGEVTVEV